MSHSAAILIVEDEAIVAADLQETLGAMGYDPFAIAASADEALACAAERCPDVVLMDVRIQGERDGIATAALLRERFGVPVLYMTAHADTATIERAKYTTPHGYLTKPVKPADLRSAIEMSLHRHAADRRQRAAQQQVELSDRLASLGTIAAGVAHEINNPLAIIVGNLSLALADIGRAKVGMSGAEVANLGEMLGDIEAATNRVTKIVAELQTFTRKPAVRSRVARVDDAIAWATRATQEELRTKARLVVDTDRDLVVQLDDAKLGQLLVNLLVNAARACEGAVDGNEVRVTARADGGDVVIEVRDTGCGMTPDVQKRIFDPFYTTRRVGDGTGLGLAICHGIASSARGSIRVASSEPGRGTTIEVRLPAQALRHSGRVPVQHAQPWRKGRVLVVDDGAGLASAVERVLVGHDLIRCADPAEAVARVDAGEAFDLVLAATEAEADLAAQLRPELADRVLGLARPIGTLTLRDLVQKALSELAPQRPSYRNL